MLRWGLFDIGPAVYKALTDSGTVDDHRSDGDVSE